MNIFLAKYSKRDKAILFSSLIIVSYWIIASIFPIHKYAIVGAFFENTWLIMVILIWLMPIVSLVFLIKERFRPKILLWLSLIISTGLLIYLNFYHNLQIYRHCNKQPNCGNARRNVQLIKYCKMRIRYKVILLLLLPIIVIVGGSLSDIPNTGIIGFLIFLFYVILGVFLRRGPV